MVVFLSKDVLKDWDLVNVGYLDLEYLNIYKLYLKCDVYFFGVLFIEFFIGRWLIDMKRMGVECFIF